MDISFVDAKLEKIVADERKLLKAFGKNRAKLLQRRLAVLEAAHTLDDISRTRPERCHELVGNRKGQLSIDLDHPFRLIFVQGHAQRPEKADGGLDWSNVTAIRIVEIVDTHD